MLAPRTAEEWAKGCDWAIGGMCCDCARAYAAACVEAWREKAASMIEGTEFVVTKPTIVELENILEHNEPGKVQILPTGELKVGIGTNEARIAAALRALPIETP